MTRALQRASASVQARGSLGSSLRATAILRIRLGRRPSRECRPEEQEAGAWTRQPNFNLASRRGSRRTRASRCAQRTSVGLCRCYCWVVSPPPRAPIPPVVPRARCTHRPAFQTHRTSSAQCSLPTPAPAARSVRRTSSAGRIPPGQRTWRTRRRSAATCSLPCPAPPQHTASAQAA